MLSNVKSFPISFVILGYPENNMSCRFDINSKNKIICSCLILND